MKAAVWSKPATQAAIKSLREAGIKVNKIDSGYESFIKTTLIFRAMVGSRGYLVRYDERIFEKA